MVVALLALLVGADRIALAPAGVFHAPAGKCVRLVAKPGQPVRVNGLAAGETGPGDGVLDITGYLRTGVVNKVDVSGPAHLLISPLVYLDRAERSNEAIQVTVVNTTENTVQVELGATVQFTLSPGTSTTREVRHHSGSSIRMRATSDGLDLTYEDEIPIS